jgi:hypothetical protein
LKKVMAFHPLGSIFILRTCRIYAENIRVFFG